ncbi:RNA 2',3'-cyclic phosphodiesterase [Patescibacteria group bacterium]|nr:RNA 2',3'-cyclic phosphodiesterase [Patescibacteria group bacterium]
MKRRLFIALDLPEDLKRSLAREVEAIRYHFTDDVRFMAPEQWHITLAFLGDQTDETLPLITAAMEKIGKRFTIPEIELTNIGYGPTAAALRMVWLNGSDASSRALQPLSEALTDALVEEGVTFRREFRQFRIHITLARFMTHDNLPELNRPFTHAFEVPAMDLMESTLTRSGAEYALLQKIKFQVD